MPSKRRIRYSKYCIDFMLVSLQAMTRTNLERQSTRCFCLATRRHTVEQRLRCDVLLELPNCEATRENCCTSSSNLDICNSAAPRPAKPLFVRGCLSSPLPSSPGLSQCCQCCHQLASLQVAILVITFSGLNSAKTRYPITTSCSVSSQCPSPTNNSPHSTTSSSQPPTN